jgi:AraC-like DNA-binding protein
MTFERRRLLTITSYQTSWLILDMIYFVKRALENKPEKTKEEWIELVRKNWNMECEFDGGVERKLHTASWLMGDLRFDALDLSGQQWIWKPDFGSDGWRKQTLLMFMSESGLLQIKQQGEVIELDEQALLILDGSVEYTQTSGPDTRAVIIRVPRAVLEGKGKLLSSREILIPDPSSPDVALLMSWLAGATAYGEQCSSYGGRMFAEHFIDLLEILTDGLTASKRRMRSHDRLRKVKRFIARNLGNEDIDPDSVASAMGMSARQLMRLFEQDGSSVMRYLLQQRLEKAKGLLIHGGDDLRIGDVAWQCGFVSASHFSRAFKRQFGESPTELQRSVREKRGTKERLR